MKTLNRVCPKCGKKMKIAFDGKNMYFAKCTSGDFTSKYSTDDKQKVIENWENGGE